MVPNDLERAWNAAITLYRPSLEQLLVATHADRAIVHDPFRGGFEPTLYLGNNLFATLERRPRRPGEAHVEAVFLMLDATKGADAMKRLVEPLPPFTIAGVSSDASAEAAAARLLALHQIELSLSSSVDLDGKTTQWSVWAGPLSLEYEPTTAASNSPADSELTLVRMALEGPSSFEGARIAFVT